MIVSRVLFIKIKFSNGIEKCFVCMYVCVGITCHICMSQKNINSITYKSDVTCMYACTSTHKTFFYKNENLRKFYFDKKREKLL